MYELDKLNYLYQDLEPFIDTHTMALHYQKHAKKYLDNLNKILKEENYNKNVKLEDIYKDINNFKEDKREDLLFNLGGVVNHNLYFKSISKNPKKPEKKLLEKILKKYKSLDNFYNELVQEALKIKGSGYVFVVLDKSNEIEILQRQNQSSPILNGYIPLLNIDMWEHAYYLNYKNNKEEYLNNFLNIIDFNNANKIVNNL